MENELIGLVESFGQPLSEDKKNLILHADKLVLVEIDEQRAGFSKAKLIVPPLTPPTIDVCDFTPLPGSENFSLTVNDCNNHANTKRLIVRWKNMKAPYKKSISAIDLNNLGCAYLWNKPPNLSEAARLFKEALDKAPADSKAIIQKNWEAALTAQKWISIDLALVDKLSRFSNISVITLSSEDYNRLVESGAE